MQLKSFDRNGNAEITINESEINALDNALYEYFEVYKPNKIDKRLYEIRRKLYIFYEIIHHNACFDETTFRILEKMKPDYKENEEWKRNIGQM